MAGTAAKANDIENLLQQSHSLLPDLTISRSDLTTPTEAIVTRIFVHYLRAFGFRVDPPHKIDSEVADTSRDKRVFLIRLCGQVERIMQICFPNKTYSYPDIIRPAAKKTLNTLGFLFNYLAYYKMFKKNVLGPVDELVKSREALYAEVAAKMSQLEQRREKVASAKSDAENCDANINQLKEELRLVQAKLAQQKKSLSGQMISLEVLEQQMKDLNNRIAHLEQMVVKDSDVIELQKLIHNTNSLIECCKKELSGKEQVFTNQRQQIETSQQMAAEIEKLIAQAPANKIEEYKKNCKLLETALKEVALLKDNYQKSLQEIEAMRQQLQETEKQLQKQKQQLDKEDQTSQKVIEVRQAQIEDKRKCLDKLARENRELDEQIEQQEQIHATLQENIHELLGEVTFSLLI
ncbi:hypothetical protein KR009_008652 [Drosophila setifemur]|nr:hypothetical protein KR009_008652 [Drosophila setifemur]